MSKINMTMSGGNSALDMNMNPKQSGTGSTSNYEDLNNKPKINDNELVGNKTAKELGLVDEATYKALEEIVAKKLNDVLVGGLSIKDENGNANIPQMSAGKFGVAQIWNAYGVDIHKNGYLMIAKADTTNINARDANYRAIVPTNLDYAVKKALCDGKGEAYTSEEQQQAQERLGLEWKLLGDLTLEEDGVNIIKIPIDNPNYNEYQFYVSLKRNATTSTNMIVGFNGVTSTSFVPSYIGIGTNATYTLRGHIMRNCNNGWLSNVWGSITGEPCNVGGSKAVRYYGNDTRNTGKPVEINVSLAATTLDKGTQFIVYAR